MSPYPFQMTSPNYSVSLLSVIILIIPLASSCLRTANNPGDFLPATRPASAKIFTVPSRAAANRDSNPGRISAVRGTDIRLETTTTIRTRQSTTTATPILTTPSTPSRLLKRQETGKSPINHVLSKEAAFRKHMEQYRGIFSARTYQAKTFVKKSEAKGDARLTRRNESESSGGISLQKSSELKKTEAKAGLEAKEGGRGMCSTCPEVMISSTEHLRQQCDNWKSIEDNFLMNMDVTTPKVVERHTATECFKTVVCPEPHVIVRWFDYSMCDVTNAVIDVSSFDVKCNGTHWTMHDFALDGVTCAKKIQL